MLVPEFIAGRDARVLVTGAGGPAAICFMEALAGMPVECFAGDIDRYAAGLHLVDHMHQVLLPRGDDPTFTDQLLAVCDALAIDVVVPTVEVELVDVARRRADFEAVGTRVLAASSATLERCLDKWTLAQHLPADVAAPITALLDESFDATAWEWPAIVKPRRGSGSTGVAMVRAATALDTYARDGSMIVQSLLPGTEYSIDVLAYRNGHIAAAVPRSRLKVDSGIAVAAVIEADPELEALGRAVAVGVGLTTVANVQVKRDPQGRARLLEINPRFPGTMSLTVRAGVNMPAWSLADTLGSPVPDHVTYESLAVVRHMQDTFIPTHAFETVATVADLAASSTRQVVR